MSTPAAQQIEDLLSAARRARTDEDLGSCRTLLEQAGALADTLTDDHPLRHVVAWKASKAAFDDEAPIEALVALAPVLDATDPFEHHPSGLNAAEPLARAVWDRHGYGHPDVERLWAAWGAAHRRRGDPYLAAMGDVQRAWQLACSGRLDVLREVLEQYAVLDPRSFGDGPHRHPRAPDAPTSVFWVQMDLARTALRAATWAVDDDLGRVALELYEDALAEAGVHRLREYWFVESGARAAAALGWERHEDVTEAWLALSSGLEHPRAALHQGLADAERARRSGDGAAALHALVQAMRLARSLQAGPEWEIDARLEAVRTARALGAPEDVSWLQDAMGLVEQASVDVFLPSLRQLEQP